VQDFKEKIDYYLDQFAKIQGNQEMSNIAAMPGNTFFLEDGSILSIPRSDGDNRFPYGEDGSNFWTYASGYMHANEGLFSTFLRPQEGQEPKLAFFAGWKRVGKEYDTLSLFAVPKLEEVCFGQVIRFTVFTNSCAYYITQAREMSFAIRVFVDEGRHIYCSIRITNYGRLPQQLYLSAYLNPFLSHHIYETSENRWYRKAEYRAEDSLKPGHFIISINEDLSRTKSVTNFGVINQSLLLEEDSQLLRQEATTSRYQFVGGINSSLHTAKALRQGCFDDNRTTTAFHDTAVAGEILHLKVIPEKTVRLDIELSYIIHSDNPFDYNGLIHRLISTDIDEAVKNHEQKCEREECTLKGSFAEGFGKPYNGPLLTFFFNYLKKQVEFCSSIKGYVQLSEGSLIGIRDVFQALEGMLYFKPEKARAKILEALGFIMPSGRCPRQYSLPANDRAQPAMDLRQFIDQGSWVINTIITYLKFTGDFGVLDQTCGYYEIEDEKSRKVKKSSVSDSVLSHLLRIMDYLILHRDPATGCIRALYGDWNDALDGLGVSMDGEEEFGSGVSVMATLQVYQNLSEMIELLSLLNGYEDYSVVYQRLLKDLEKALIVEAIITNEAGERRIVHGWGDRQAYYVGSFRDPDDMSRYGLTSNAYWVISGIYQKDIGMKETILNAFDHLDSRYGMKTFEPYFMPGTTGVGRIYKLPPGTAENGASYIHATAFGIKALFMMGEPQRAWDQIMKIFPFTHAYISCSPYVMPNSYGYNEELNIDGESMLDWQTGSSNVVLKIIINHIFGFQPEFGGFFIKPAAWIPFQTYHFEIAYQGISLHISYRNRKAGKRCFFVNKNRVMGSYDDNLKTDKLWIARNELEKECYIEIED
jgi:hypothetical protein